MLAKHVEGKCRFYGVVVETPEGGPRRLSLWEAGAAMGSEPLPWPTDDLSRWWMALGNALPTAIPGQVLQAMQNVGGLKGDGTLDFARRKRDAQRCSLPIEVVDSP